MSKFLRYISFVFVLFLLSASSINAQYRINRSAGELVLGSPEEVGVDGEILSREISKIMTEAIDSMAFPGAQVLLAKGGIVFYKSSFGFHTYDSLRKVQDSDLYDLASVTKVTAATLALMKLYDEGLFDLDQTFGYYFPKIAKGDKAELRIREILAHQAGLKAWIPYWSESQRKNGKWRWNTVKTDSSRRFPTRLEGTGLFLHKDFKEKKIYKMIRKSEVSEDKTYLYSGLFFYLIPELVERLSGVEYEEYLNNNFYQPLYAETLGFNPTNRFSLNRIVPTENDTFFRQAQLQGVVHDEGAAMMLGVSGNAGLFSNSMDLAKVYQMLLNDGKYGTTQYLKAETVKEFTSVQFPENDNRRGLGFDKPLLEYNERISSVAKDASPESYGHTGYTGTLVWADPANDLLFIFLSNRVYPNRNNSKIYSLNVRPNIHNLVYELLRIGDGTYTIGTHWE